VGLALWYGDRRAIPPSDRAVRSLTLKIEGEAFDALKLPVASFYTPFAISPNGMRLVFRAGGAGPSQLFLRELEGFGTRALPGTQGATTPFFSPDGRWIGFWRAEDRILRKVSVMGGSPIEIAHTDTPSAALWTTNDSIVIDTGDAGLQSIPAAGGAPEAIAVPNRANGESITLRAGVPGRRDLLVASRSAHGDYLSPRVTVASRSGVETGNSSPTGRTPATTWKSFVSVQMESVLPNY